MNYCSFIVKIIKKPQQKFHKKDIPVTQVVAKFYQSQENSPNICTLNIWGNLSYDVIQYYQINDYLIIEGYISKRKLNEFNLDPNIEISVFKIYPFALNDKI